MQVGAYIKGDGPNNIYVVTGISTDRNGVQITDAIEIYKKNGRIYEINIVIFGPQDVMTEEYIRTCDRDVVIRAALVHQRVMAAHNASSPPPRGVVELRW